MVPAATTVGGYLQSLPNDRRVSMARVCSMIRRSARGVRESMRFGLAFYELDGPIFAVKSHDKSLTLYYAEKDAAAAGVGRPAERIAEPLAVAAEIRNGLPARFRRCRTFQRIQGRHVDSAFRE